jgi:hypothetical protein
MIRSVGTPPSSRHGSLLPVDPSIDTGRAANWAVGERPLSRRRGVCIIDGSGDPGVDGWRNGSHAQISFSRRS